MENSPTTIILSKDVSLGPRLLAWLRKDFIVIIICLLCLLACLYTLNTVGEIQQKINQAWLQEWESSGCKVKPYVPNITINMVVIRNEN